MAPLFLRVRGWVTHLEGFRFASICHTGFVMHIYEDDELLLKALCEGRSRVYSMVARKHQNETPALK